MIFKIVHIICKYFDFFNCELDFLIYFIILKIIYVILWRIDGYINGLFPDQGLHIHSCGFFFFFFFQFFNHFSFCFLPIPSLNPVFNLKF